MSMLPVTFAALAAVLYIAIATVLVRQYLRTHDVAFAWLGAAVLGWPLLSPLLEYGQRVLIRRVGSGPFYTAGDLVMTIACARLVVGLALVFVAVFQLSRTKPTERVA
jgi:hypothetical protein